MTACSDGDRPWRPPTWPRMTTSRSLATSRARGASGQCGPSSSAGLGWTPLELVKHLTFVELRWLQWGFEGQEVSDPWGDRRDERWFVAETESREDVIAALAAQARRSRAIIQSNDLATLAQPGPRFEDGDAPTLERILLHLLQEYSHHLGHLDIVVEIALADRHT